jgi:hypothetical protein
MVSRIEPNPYSPPEQTVAQSGRFRSAKGLLWLWTVFVAFTVLFLSHFFVDGGLPASVFFGGHVLLFAVCVLSANAFGKRVMALAGIAAVLWIVAHYVGVGFLMMIFYDFHPS